MCSKTFYVILFHQRFLKSFTLVFVFAVSIAIFITGYYYYNKDSLFHQNAFALLTAEVFLRSLYAMEVSLRPSRQAKRRVDVRSMLLAVALEAAGIACSCRRLS